MSDIDDLLGEFDAPAGKQGYERYIPDPVEALGTYRGMAQSGWDTAAQGISQLGSFGSDPLSRIKGVGNLALGGAQMAGAIPAAVGKYVGAPIGRAVEDITGSPTAGQVVGGTAELAPAMLVPFPGATAIRTGPEAASMVAGELPAARMVTEGIIGKFAGRAAPTTSGAYDDFEDLVDEIAGGTRKTSAAKDVDYRTAEDWYKRVLTDYNPESTMPPMSPPVPRDIRLLHKGSPKVGERKYAQDEAGKPVVMPGYADEGGVPTFRTSHSPRMPQQPEAPVGEYENVFQREIAGQPQISQMPLHPGTRPDVLEDMWLPNVRNEMPTDPRLLAELKLKFGGGSPQGQLDNPPWTPQQTAGVRPPAQMPIAGARPMQEPTPNVLLPSDMMPVAMGTEARQNTNRLRQGLGVPLNPEEVQRQTRAPLAERPPIPEKPVTPAQAPKAVTQYGDIEVGQPYDIVMNMGGQEMRSAGGTVKELIYKNEPVVKSGKSVMESVGYAVLEDGRQVPTKLLQRTGTAQPNIQMNAPATTEMPRLKTSNPPVASSEQTADPAFAKVQSAMEKKTKGEPTVRADRTPVVKAIFDARNKYGSRTTHSQIKEFAPTATRAQIDKALKEAQKTHPRLASTTGKDGEPVIYMRKASAEESVNEGAKAKAEHFERAVKKIFTKKKSAYLHEFDPYDVSKRHKVDISEQTAVNEINKRIKDGTLRVYPEGDPKKPLKTVTAKHLKDRKAFDNDFIVESVQPKGKK